MRVIKRPNITYRITSCNSCFYNSSVYSDECPEPICQKTMDKIKDESKIPSNCPLEIYVHESMRRWVDMSY